MSHLDRTRRGTDSAAARLYPWLPGLSTLATLATMIVLSLIGNGPAAVTAGLLGISGLNVSVHIGR
ncbi:hypothetical protein ACIQVK_19630 [Streptomyces sp. NPDC090493]|uniref:hypothetical protein n=1 Tax=Streptomyces sp. NPDC090493 TaxID=3365964 RepID=UPI00380DC45E